MKKKTSRRLDSIKAAHESEKSISISDRVEDSQSKVIITADGGYRKGKIINLKEIVDEKAAAVNSVEHIIILERTKMKISLHYLKFIALHVDIKFKICNIILTNQ